MKGFSSSKQAREGGQDQSLEQLKRSEHELERKHRRIEELENRVEELQRENERLKKEIAELQLNSTNSSKPPSSDGLAGPQRDRCRTRSNPKKRRPGGQPGHAGRTRVASEQVSEVIHVEPDTCSDCGIRWSQETRQAQKTGQGWKRQVLELPPMQPYVVEYRGARVTCPDCGKVTEAKVPIEAVSPTGPRLTAFVAYLTASCRMPRRVVVRMLEDALGIELSVGCVQRCWEQTGEAVGASCQELERKLPEQSVVNVDETGWRQSGEKRWLWAFVAQTFTVFVVSTSRGTQVLEAMLGAAFAGLVGSDRLATYMSFREGTGQMQLCWAHLKRNMRAILDQAGDDAVAQCFARDALAQTAKLFRLWWKFKSGQIDRSQLIHRSLRIKRAFWNLAVTWWDSDNRKVANLANAIGENSSRMFLFLEQEGVEPTNNAAERALRTAVQWRKTSFGNRSDRGAVATARLLTVVQTSAMQGRPILAFLVEAVKAHRSQLPSPSLLPLKK